MYKLIACFLSGAMLLAGRKQLITKHLTAALMLGGLAMLVAGCSSDHYYRVTNPTTGNEYYTTKIEDAGKGGAVKIKDDKTGSIVTLQSHDVKEISENEYQAGLTAPPKPAPVRPAAVQPATPQAAPAQPAAVQPEPAAAQAAPAQP